MRIFATNQDIGSANAMVPALKLLQSEGVEILLFFSIQTNATRLVATAIMSIQR